MSPEKVSGSCVSSLIACFADLPDPRIERCRRHPLINIVVIGLCAVICGGTGPSDMETFGEERREWLEQFLELPDGIPSHDTFGRVLGLIAPTEFARCLRHWITTHIRLSEGEVVALDGKTLRGSQRRPTGEEAIEIVSAWAVSQRLTLGQQKVPAGTNEITTVPEVLRELDLHGCIVTVDALNCQKAVAAQIRRQGADYVLALKDNHKTLHAEVKDYIAAVRDDRTHGFAMATHQTVDGEHGRIETRRYWQAAAPDHLPDKAAWPDLRSVGMVESSRDIHGKVTIEKRCYLSSLPVDAAEFGRAVRSHWGIENSCHWVLDVVLREDDCRLRVGNAAENMSLLRRFALNLLRREKTEKRGIHAKQMKAALSLDYLIRVLSS